MKRFGKLESYKIKQIVFLSILVLIVALLWLAFSNQGTVIPILLGAATVALIVFLVMRYDFLLTLKEYERAVIFRFGRVVRVGGPGWALMIPVIESFRLVDLRTQTIDIPPQEVITKDKVVVKADAIIYLFVRPDKQSVINSVIEIQDYVKAATSFVQATVRDVAGNFSLTELISNIGELNKRVQRDLEAIAKEWGVTVESVQISEITIPKELEEALTKQKAAEQQKLARAELAQAQQIEIDAVRTAAEQLSDRSLAYYYIRALEKLGEGQSTKFIFPLELTQLAERISASVQSASTNKTPSELETVFRKYLPAIEQAVRKKNGST